MKKSFSYDFAGLYRGSCERHAERDSGSACMP